MNNMLDYFKVFPDFPKEGINFYDIQSVLAQPVIWKEIINNIVNRIKDDKIDMIVGIEARGFIVAVPVAYELELPFGMIRKPGKLPSDVISQEYALEYGTDKIEIQKDILKKDMKVVIIDDLLATGGTMKAAGDLIQKAGAEVVKSICIIELPELQGRQKLDFSFEALIQAPLDPAKGF